MKRQQKKYQKPMRLWDRARIEAEKKVEQSYGLRRKKELWKAESILRNYRGLARELAASKDKEKEKILITKLAKMGLLSQTASLDDVLALTVENVLERRLQTLAYRKGLAKTAKEARQMIVHGHVAVNDKRVVWPGMLVTLDDEGKIKYYGTFGAKK